MGLYKKCIYCGEILFESRRRLCDDCRREAKKEADKRARAKALAKKYKKSASVKNLIGCVKSADKLGITYGNYMGSKVHYDKKLIEKGEINE